MSFFRLLEGTTLVTEIAYNFSKLAKLQKEKGNKYRFTLWNTFFPKNAQVTKLLNFSLKAPKSFSNELPSKYYLLFFVRVDNFLVLP